MRSTPDTIEKFGAEMRGLTNPILIDICHNYKSIGGIVVLLLSTLGHSHLSFLFDCEAHICIVIAHSGASSFVLLNTINGNGVGSAGQGVKQSVASTATIGS